MARYRSRRDPPSDYVRGSYPSGKRDFYVYVIESIDDKGKHLFYVGQSAFRPEQRLEQHEQGSRYCTDCSRRYYVKGGRMRIRWDLFSHYNPLKSRLEAERVESFLANHLRKRGYTVRGGH